MTTLLHSSKFFVRFGLASFAIFATVFVFGQCPPPTPTSNPVTINCGATATLTASGSPNYIWYSDAAGTNMVGTGASYTTPALTSNTTMYLRGSAGAAQAGTQTYNISSYGQLVNVPNNCCGGTSSYYNCGGSVGFNWNDNLAAGTQITSVQIQISVGVNCHGGQALTPQLNNNNGTPFSPADHCNCCGSNNNIFTFNFQPNQYVVAGANQFRIPLSTCFGFFNGHASLNGLYARVTVNYQNIPCTSPVVAVPITVTPLSAPTANPVSINCGNTATLTASGSPGSYVWYSDAAATQQVGTGASFTTPALVANTTYYVASASAGGAAAGTVYTFTNCSATGQFGPTQAQVNNAYASTNLNGQVTSQSGVQLWTVPSTGTYRIEAFGAQGGGNNQFGRGAQIRGDFALNAGQQLKIIVGQQGGLYGSGSGSGGGGSFVATSANVPMIVAGGGGGQYDSGSSLFNAHAVTSNNGQASGCTSGGAGGAGGSGCNNSGASGGGGFNSNGGSGSYGTGGLSFSNGGNGGNHGSNAVCV